MFRSVAKRKHQLLVGMFQVRVHVCLYCNNATPDDTMSKMDEMVKLEHCTRSRQHKRLKRPFFSVRIQDKHKNACLLEFISSMVDCSHLSVRSETMATSSVMAVQ